MSRNTIFFILLLTSLTTSTAAFSQADTLYQNKRLNIRYSPQHLLMKAIVADVEKSVSKNLKHNLVFIPQYNYEGVTFSINATPRYGYANEKLRAYGLEVQHRYYTARSAEKQQQNFYLSYGLKYQHVGIRYGTMGWVEAQESDGLLYYKRTPIVRKENINRLGGVLLLGLQQVGTNTPLVIDFYCGLGYITSHSSLPEIATYYNKNFLDYAYSGTYLIAGIKFGVAIK
ncbi:hypothetical protein FVR03_22045 [Pontibacter qinzhouensis]|uniref:DUF3575 domain-containing protein n=1 Tax=Pontibacter qinzhouensis TaxID=2603253 RepID=A0A5C8IUQ1_9BACT|nr:hypothetical protein [Pontibacter qinzhouensis]TXK25020.1 hypothetical protein FVR03_22045 [Pontibacter qinzhouensis]